YRQCDMGGGGAAHWYGCDALGAGRNGVADLSGERRAVRMAEGYLGFITRARRGGRAGAGGGGGGGGAGAGGGARGGPGGGAGGRDGRSGRGRPGTSPGVRMPGR